jgi:hypothetical protein
MDSILKFLLFTMFLYFCHENVYQPERKSIESAFQKLGEGERTSGRVWSTTKNKSTCSARAFSEIWSEIKCDEFVRRWTANAEKTKSREDFWYAGVVDIGSGDELVDSGGLHGIPERLEASSGDDVENFRSTRCSSANFAVTNYFCGIATASNHLEQAQSHIDSFLPTVSKRKGRNSVYRFGCGQVAPGPHDVRMDHVWTIVALQVRVHVRACARARVRACASAQACGHVTVHPSPDP